VSWIVFLLLPVSGVVAMSPYLGADRYTYLPQMGLAVLVAFYWPSRFPAGWIAGGVAALVAILLLVRTEQRIQDWRDSESLFRAEVALSPRSKLAALHLGAALLDSGRPEEALVWFEKSLAIDPKFDLALNNAALARQRIAEKSEAR
jgi:tetratricopeptide (TPR) repeat protein